MMNPQQALDRFGLADAVFLCLQGESPLHGAHAFLYQNKQLTRAPWQPYMCKCRVRAQC